MREPPLHTEAGRTKGGVDSEAHLLFRDRKRLGRVAPHDEARRHYTSLSSSTPLPPHRSSACELPDKGPPTVTLQVFHGACAGVGHVFSSQLLAQL